MECKLSIKVEPDESYSSDDFEPDEEEFKTPLTSSTYYALDSPCDLGSSLERTNIRSDDIITEADFLTRNVFSADAKISDENFVEAKLIDEHPSSNNDALPKSNGFNIMRRINGQILIRNSSSKKLFFIMSYMSNGFVKSFSVDVGVSTVGLKGERDQIKNKLSTVQVVGVKESTLVNVMSDVFITVGFLNRNTIDICRINSMIRPGQSWTASNRHLNQILLTYTEEDEEFKSLRSFGLKLLN